MPDETSGIHWLLPPPAGASWTAPADFCASPFHTACGSSREGRFPSTPVRAIKSMATPSCGSAGRKRRCRRMQATQARLAACGNALHGLFLPCFVFTERRRKRGSSGPNEDVAGIKPTRETATRRFPRHTVMGRYYLRQFAQASVVYGEQPGAAVLPGLNLFPWPAANCIHFHRYHYSPLAGDPENHAEPPSIKRIQPVSKRTSSSKRSGRAETARL